jgi:hypothetical protein
MSLAYRDSPAKQLTSEALNTEKERRRHLFDTYIDKMFIRKGKGTRGYTREHTLGWLIWLARGMQQHDQTVFLIEQIQPSWLTTRGQRVVYVLGSRMFFGLIFELTAGLMFGLMLISGLRDALILGLVPGLIDERRVNRGPLWTRIEKSSPRLQTVIIVLIVGLIIGVIVGLQGGLIFGLQDGLAAGLLAGLIFGLFWGLRSRHRSLTSDIQSVETLRWSWVHARKGCISGLIVGLISGLIGGLSDWLIAELQGGLIGGLSDLITDLPDALTFGLIVGLRNGLWFGLIGSLIGALFGGFRSGILPVKGIPNLGIRLSIRNAVLATGLVVLAFCLFGLGIGLIGKLDFVLLVGGLILGQIFWLIAFFWYGGQDVIQHYILRFILYWKGHTPLRYANFLDYAARLVFLQKVGGGYIFIHRLLLEHFAAMRKDGEESTRTNGGSPL